MITQDEKKQALHLLRYNDMHNFADDYMKNDKLLELYRELYKVNNAIKNHEYDPYSETAFIIYKELGGRFRKKELQCEIKKLEAENK